jgi:hypothetical protein
VVAFGGRGLSPDIRVICQGGELDEACERQKSVWGFEEET